MKDTQKAVINWQYFLFNHPYNWIEKCFPNDKYIVDEYINICNKNNHNSTIGLMKFFMELDRRNQEIVTKWVEENYLSFENLKF